MKKLILVPIILSLLFPGLALTAPSTTTPTAGALPKLTAMPSYKALVKNVKNLEGRSGSASDSVKAQLNARLATLHSTASVEVAKRFKIRRQEDRKKNRDNLTRESNNVEKSYKAEIKSVVSQYKIELVELKNSFKQEARDLRIEWAPKIKSLKNKISRAKQYIAGKALKKYKKRIIRKIKRVVEVREDRVEELRDVYLAERQSIVADRNIEVLDIREQLREAKAEVKQRYDGFWLTKSSALRAQRDSEKKRIDDLRARGQKAIQQL
jgi:hypothetical protein